MNILTSLTDVSLRAWPYLLSGGIVLAFCVAFMAWQTWRPRKNTGQPAKQKATLENRLTFLVAVIIAAICAQGMGRFFYDQLHFPIELVIVVGGVLELTAFTCALRARRNILDPKVGKAGVDGIAVWVVTALSGGFSAMDADKPQVAVFRLVMPLLAAWLWERGMSIERRRVRGGSTIHWRVTPERVLVWLRIAEPSGRTASEVDAHRRLTRVAKAAAKVRALRRDEAWDWRIEFAQRRLDRAMRSAVAHAGLAADPARQQALIAQLGSMYNADALADLTPDAPWSGFAQPTHRTFFEANGLPFNPVRFEPLKVLQSEPLQIGSGTSNPDQVQHSTETRSETRSDPQHQTKVPDPNSNRSQTHGPDRSADQVPDPTQTQVPDLPDPRVPDPDDKKVPDQVPEKPKTRKTQTGPKKQTRSKPKPKPLDRLAEAKAADKAYLAEHGRHIPAEKLARALSIGKPAALELVKQVRGGHLEIAK